MPALLIIGQVKAHDDAHHVWVSSGHTHNNIKLHVDATAQQGYVFTSYYQITSRVTIRSVAAFALQST